MDTGAEGEAINWALPFQVKFALDVYPSIHVVLAAGVCCEPLLGSCPP